MMDSPFIQQGWMPIKYEPSRPCSDVPDALCDYLAENPRLSFFLTPEMHFKDEDGNDLKIERWTTQKKMMDGAH